MKVVDENKMKILTDSVDSTEFGYLAIERERKIKVITVTGNAYSISNRSIRSVVLRLFP